RGPPSVGGDDYKGTREPDCRETARDPGELSQPVVSVYKRAGLLPATQVQDHDAGHRKRKASSDPSDPREGHWAHWPNQQNGAGVRAGPKEVESPLRDGEHFLLGA